MSRATREQVYAALFAQLATLPGLKTVSRRIRNAQDMQPEEMPAAFQLQGEQIVKYQGNTPAIYTWKADWLLYTNNSDPTISPTTQLNALIDAATAAIAPAFGKQTLGGLVEYCAIDGNIQVFEGIALGNTAIAIVPVSILLPGF